MEKLRLIKNDIYFYQKAAVDQKYLKRFKDSHYFCNDKPWVKSTLRILKIDLKICINRQKSPNKKMLQKYGQKEGCWGDVEKITSVS